MRQPQVYWGIFIRQFLIGEGPLRLSRVTTDSVSNCNYLNSPDHQALPREEVWSPPGRHGGHFFREASRRLRRSSKQEKEA